MSAPRYLACWTEDDGIYSCGHQHKTIVEAMKCLVPNGGNFIRAYEAGASRPLDDQEFLEFIRALADDALEFVSMESNLPIDMRVSLVGLVLLNTNLVEWTGLPECSDLLKQEAREEE